MHRGTFIALLIAVFSVCGLQPVFAANYSAHALGFTPGFDGSWANDINDSGLVLGCSASISGFATFIWSDYSRLTELDQSGNGSNSGINKYGQTLGIYRDEASGWHRPYVRNIDGTTRRLILPDGVADAWGASIDDSGRVITNMTYRDSDRHMTQERYAVIAEDGSITYIDVPENDPSFTTASNNGTAILNGKYLWTAADGLNEVPWLTNAEEVGVRGVNDLGWIVGMKNNHAVRWDTNGNMFDLGVGVAFGISNSGQVVGSVGNQPVIWNADGSITTLPHLEGYSSATGYGINNKGQVVGVATTEDRQWMAVLWTPEVPEPSSLAALGLGLVPMAGAVIRRRRVSAVDEH